MAEPNKVQDKTYTPPVKEAVEEVKKVDYTKKSDTVSAFVRIVSLIDARVLITGTVTRTQYEFARAGTVVAVDSRDANEILNKKKGRACCGGESGKSLFQLV
jgi:hypothetical protein